MESKDIVNESLRFIETHLEMPITVADIASAIGYSEFHFSRIFKQAVGTSVMEYVKRRKMIRASESILDGNKIIDVALNYGWQSHSGFTKAFKNEFGFYPSVLRAMLIELNHCGGRNMSHLFLKRTEEHATKEQLLEILKSEIIENGIDFDMADLQKVYEYACLVYSGIKRYSGDEYITHLLNIAIILVEMNAGSNVVCAGMFCDALTKTSITIEELKNNLPADVILIVEKLKEFEAKAEFFDDEVVVIKLAERLHNMRTTEYMDKEKVKVKAKETMDIFMPLARRLKNEKIISELNDLALQYLY